MKKPEIIVIVSAFKCKHCKEIQRISQFGNKYLTAPTSCPNGCDVTKKGFEWLPYSSDWIDQETGEFWH